MKRIVLLMSAIMVLTACSPVLDRELMKQGLRDVPFSQLRAAPDTFKGKLFILGGIIVGARFTETGLLIEALYIPVDSSGYLEEGEHSHGRFLAFYPKSSGLLDPIVYRKGREITLAAEFLETKKGKIDDMEYIYPVFEIRQIYLWDEMRHYYNYPYYNYPYDPFYYSPFMYDRFGRPYPGPFWPPPPW
jgi:outer membrane lipoprotein